MEKPTQGIPIQTIPTDLAGIKGLSMFQKPVSQPTAQTTSTVLVERGKRYGMFSEHARITQNIKRAMEDSPNWKSLAPDQREALEMIAHKAGRILNGDPNYDDSWVDISGYATLVAKELQCESL